MYFFSYNCFSGARESAAKLTPVIYRLNTQFGAKMEIEIYRYQKFVVLALTWVEFFCFKDIP